MANPGTEFNSSVGRIVWGHPTKLMQRRDNDEKLIFNDDGTPAMGAAFGLAIPKQAFMQNEWPHLQSEASKAYPNGNVPQNFSWKFKDGDTDKDSKGVPLANKEGYAGCYILTIASNTGFPPAAYRFNPQNGQYVQMKEEELKTGDFVSVAIKTQVNVPQKATHTPSLYVNPQAIEFVGYGTALSSGGVDPMKAFGGRQHQLPPGASATPIGGAPAGMGMPGTQQPHTGIVPGNTQQPGYPPQQQPMPGMMPGYGQPGMPGTQQPQMPPPHTGIVPGNTQQPGYPPQQQPMPGMMPGNAPMGTHTPGVPGAMPQPGYPPQQQPMPGNGAYPSNPGYPQQMPGMPGPR